MSASDILAKLAIDARRLRVGQKLPDGPLPWEAVKRVQADFVFLLEQGGLTMEDFARALGEGFSRGTLSRFRNMSGPADYIGDADRITRGINTLLETLARRGESPKPKGWVETEVARRMLVVISKTIELCAIGLIYSDAGRGKSITMAAAATIHPGSILVRVIQPARRPAGLAKLIAQTMGLRGVDSLYKAESKIIETLKNSRRPLLIDEAHQLSLEALELLRDIHDAAGVPIVLAGTVRINEAVNDSQAFFGQFASRVALRYDVTEDLTRGLDGGGDPKPLHTVDEIRRLYEADKVRFTDDGRLLLAKIANLLGLGGLRLCEKIIQVAAVAAGHGLIDARLVLSVIRGMHGLGHATHCIDREIEQSRLKIG